MKKILLTILTVLFVVSMSNVFVLASDDKVEINFCVGDDTLLINGCEVTVEKPYVVGTGVTLVPIRVITEAFGAKVDWIAQTQTVNLEYPDVNISIQIGNSIAEVNGKAEKLLAPPELSQSGYTMIPLRFISENFGATVSYDDKTQIITVIKDKSEQGEIVKGASDCKYIGDSYYQWFMENPHDMIMDYRSFDGSATYFSDNYGDIYIEVYRTDEWEDYDFESYFNEMKLSVDGYTIIKAEKDTNNENLKFMHFSAKDKVIYYDFYHYVTADFIYEVTGNFTNEDTKKRDEYINILSTFECGFGAEDTYDLSEIIDGFRTFESDYLKLSFNIPENFYMASSKDSETDFEFYENGDGGSNMHMVVFSKSDVKSAEQLAKRDHDHNKQILNEDLIQKFTDVEKKEYNQRTVYEYEIILKATAYEEYKRDVFFEVGDYVYNMSVTVRLPKDDYNDFVDKIINSIQTEPLDVNEVGVLISSIPEATGTVKGKVGKLNFEVPNIYISNIKTDSVASYIGAINGVNITIVRSAGGNINEVKNGLKTSVSAFESEYDAKIITKVREKSFNGYKGYYYLLKVTEDDITSYVSQYAIIYKDSTYIISIACPEISYSKNARDEIDSVLKSVKFE